MNAILLAIDDGWTAANYNWADTFFVIAAILSALAGLAYLFGIDTTTTTNPNPPPRPGYYHRFHGWAPALLCFGVACIAFALFLL